MKRRKRRNRSRSQYRRAVRLLLTFAIAAALILLLDARIRPIIIGMTQSTASTISTNVVNGVVYEKLAGEDIDYNDIISLDKDENGCVAAIHSDTAKINRLKASLTTAIQNELDKYTEGSISIPLGNLTGIDFLSGIGPAIEIKFQMSASVNAEITSSLSDAAINQCRHRIMLDVATDIYIMIPAYNTSTRSNTSYCIAETVIVGSTPNSYAEMTDDLMNGPSILE